VIKESLFTGGLPGGHHRYFGAGAGRRGGLFLVGEAFGLTGYLGSALILTAVLLLTLDRRGG